MLRESPALQAGWKDLVVLAPDGITVWFEVKAPKDPQRGEHEEDAAIEGAESLHPEAPGGSHRVHIVF